MYKQAIIFSPCIPASGQRTQGPWDHRAHPQRPGKLNGDIRD